jgi:hypothetical protein
MTKPLPRVTRKVPQYNWREHRSTSFWMRGRDPRFSCNQNGDDNAKENSHRVCCSANNCINRASGGCLRTPPRACEGPRGGKRAIAEQQCLLCRTQSYPGAIILVERRRRRDEFGARWPLIYNVLRRWRVWLSEVKSGHISDVIRRDAPASKSRAWICARAL